MAQVGDWSLRRLLPLTCVSQTSSIPVEVALLLEPVPRFQCPTIALIGTSSPSDTSALVTSLPLAG